VPQWIAQAAGRARGLIGTLRGDERPRVWFHQAALDAIAAQPVPYTLTPSAEALLSASPPQQQLTRADLRLRA
jgi:hypothetical protein